MSEPRNRTYGASAAGAGACCSGRSARDEASASLWRTVSAGGGGDGDAAARSSSVRGGADGVGASEASNGVASGASEASGGGDQNAGHAPRRAQADASRTSKRDLDAAQAYKMTLKAILY